MKNDFEAGLDMALDPGIRSYVLALREGGVETFESCQGGDGHPFPVPTVRFYGPVAAGFRAFAVACECGLPVAALRLVYPVNENQLLTGPWWEITFVSLPPPEQAGIGADSSQINEAQQAALSAAPAEGVRLAARVRELEALINTPHTGDFFTAVNLEAAHQQERWGAEHDAGKEPHDWFWLLGYLSGKAIAAFGRGDKDKGLHHIVSSAACLLNWHRNVTGTAKTSPLMDLLSEAWGEHDKTKKTIPATGMAATDKPKENGNG